ncbi:hypothetical protein BGZ67_002002 [Mortierella alpina]|nr:hypothetical protein BGZ67_002002 [Mortierella alpina]
MSSLFSMALDLKCLVLGGSDEAMAYGLRESNLRTKSRRGLVYNPYNPLPRVEGRLTSNALWMEVNVAANINNTESERAQLMIDTGADDNSAMEIALTGSHLLVRHLHVTAFTTRELVGLGGWTLSRPLDDASTAQLQFYNNTLYVFSANGANDTSLAKMPFNPNSSIPNQLLPGPPTGTTSIDISSTATKCNWSSGYSTAVSHGKFYLLCQKIELGVPVRSLFTYDNTVGDRSPKLGAAVPVNGIEPSCTINMFQPLRNETFALLDCEMSNKYPEYVLLPLSGPYTGNATRLDRKSITVDHDAVFNNILPGQEEIRDSSTDGISSDEGMIALAVVLVFLAAMVFLTLRHKRRQRSKITREKDAETTPDSCGLEPLGASGVTGLSSHPSSSVGLVAGEVQSREANTHLSPTVYVAPQISSAPSPALSAGLPDSSWPTSAPAAAGAAPLSSMILSPAPSNGSPSVPISGSPPANTYQMELLQLGFWAHPRPNVVTTMND